MASQVLKCGGKATNEEILKQLLYIKERIAYIESNVEDNHNKLEEMTETVENLQEYACHTSHSVEHLCHQVHRLSAFQRCHSSGHGKPHRPIRTLHKHTNTSKVHHKRPAADDIAHMHWSEALQDNIHQFVDNIQFKETHLQDALIENGCLTEDECHHISSKPSAKDQARLLVTTMKSRSAEQIQLFLEEVRKDHANIAECVELGYHQKEKEKSGKPLCAICLMKKTANLKDVVDALWKNRIIPDELYGNIVESDQYQEHGVLWDQLLFFINGHGNTEQSRTVLLKALEKKYQHISKRLESNSTQPHLRCECIRRGVLLKCKKRLYSENSSQSLSDLSTTSEANRYPVFNAIMSPTSDEIYGDNLTSEPNDSLNVSWNQSSFGSIGSVQRSDIPSICSPPETMAEQKEPDGTVEEHQLNAPRTYANQITVGCHEQTNTVELTTVNTSRTIANFICNEYTSMPFEMGNGIISSPDIGGSEDSIGFETQDSRFAPYDCTRPYGETTNVTEAEGGYSINRESEIDYDSHNMSDDTESHDTSDFHDIPRMRKKKVKRSWKEMRRSGGQTEQVNDVVLMQMSESLQTKINEKAPRPRTKPRCAKRQKTKDSRYDGEEKLITKAKQITDQTAAKVGVRMASSRKSKTNRKRAERREHSNHSKDVIPSPPGQKIPYNPSWQQMPQRRNTCRWDELEAKKYWQMAQLYARSEGRSLYRSDTDHVLDDSDTVIQSDSHTI